MLPAPQLASCRPSSPRFSNRIAAPDAYIPFVTSLLFWIGVSFEMPLIVFFLAKLKIVTAGLLLRGWRFAIVGISIVAAVITPTVDPFQHDAGDGRR